MWVLFYESYSSKSSERNQELLHARWKNEQLFDKCVDTSVFTPRLTFSEAFEHFNANYGEGDILVLANADMSFECFNFKKAEKLLDKDTFITLSRYEKHIVDFPGKKNTTIMLEQSGNNLSQDVWIGMWPIKITKCQSDCECYKLGLKDQPTECMNFHLGVPGCDSRMNTLLGYTYKEVINPVSCLVTIHNHKSEVREGTSSLNNFGVIGIPGKYSATEFS